jgi:signal transduction histidine kinase
VFEPFFRGHVGAPNDSGGVGIGLFLAKEIVERHGGTISFASEDGVGSTFAVILPLDEKKP